MVKVVSGKEVKVEPKGQFYLEVMKVVEDVCKKGVIFPSYRKIAAEVGCSEGHVHSCMHAAIKSGVISIAGRGGNRRVTWLETGKSSATQLKNGGASEYDFGRKPDVVAEARHFLRRYYPNVYSAPITGGPKGHTVIWNLGVVPDPKVIALAVSKGWQPEVMQ